LGENGTMRRGRQLVIVLAMALAVRAPRLATAADMPEIVAGLTKVAVGLDAHVLALAVRAATCAMHRGLVSSLGVLTVIDYSRPSNEARLWVLDVPGRRLLHHDLVAHGRGSGELYATSFSNDSGSKRSSLGLFLTADTYEGAHGHSLRLRGLEPGINDHALERAIVMHGADYVSPKFAAEQGRLGRSLGCPALPIATASEVIDTLQGGTPIFAYYPDAAWLESSPFLAACSDDSLPPGLTETHARK
jgi:L,D-transpeptidase-like protein